MSSARTVEQGSTPTVETDPPEPAGQRESRARLDAMLRAAGMVGWEWDVEANVVHHLGDIEGLTGKRWEPGDRLTPFVHRGDLTRFGEAVRQAWRSGDDYRLQFRIVRTDGAVRWVCDAGRVSVFPDGRRVMSGVLTDITESKRAEAEAQESRTQLDAALKSAGLTPWGWTLERGVFVHAAGVDREPLRVDTEAQADQTHPDDQERVRAAFERAIQTEGDFSEEYRVRQADGGVRWMASRGRAFTGPDGKRRMSGVVSDVTDRKLADQRRQLLVNELNHRVKNTLAVVQGIAAQTFRGRADEQARIFQGRIMALSTAHNVLTGEGWEGASLAEIVEDAVRPFRTPGPGGADRFDVAGDDLRLPAKTALALLMALHELGANAVKHGALSAPGGRVGVFWSPASDRLHLEWREHGGPPVHEPERRGFGTRMIERGLKSELGGDASIQFEPEGVVCIVDAPLPEAVESESHA